MVKLLAMCQGCSHLLSPKWGSSYIHAKSHGGDIVLKNLHKEDSSYHACIYIFSGLQDSLDKLKKSFESEKVTPILISYLFSKAF